MKFKIFCDGGARGNPGPAAAAFVVYDDSPHSALWASRGERNLREKRGKFLGTATNNEAEYWAVVDALVWVKDQIQDSGSRIQEVSFFLDSSLVVNQLNGIFRVKNARLRELLVKIRGLEAKISWPVTYSHVPREKNGEADRLVNETLDKVQ